MKATKDRRVIPVHEDIRERHRKRQLKKKRVRFTLFCIGMLFLLFVAGTAVVFLTPWFHVDAVTVQGNAQVESADLIEASGINKGESIFAFSLGSVEENLLAVPYVKSVSVKRKLPKTISITVQESTAVARIEKDAMQICIDETGEVVYAGAQPPENLILVLGTAVEEYTLGAPLTLAEGKSPELLMEFIDAVRELGIAGGIHSVDLTVAENLTFTYGQGLRVLCGDSYDLKRKLLTFIEVAHELPENAKGEIDLRISGKGYYRP